MIETPRPSDNATDSLDCSIVIPTLNEAGNIDGLIERILAVMDDHGDFEILVVDDNSTDGTRDRVRRWELDSPVRLIAREGPADLSASVLDGAAAARGRRVLVMDADGSHPPETIPALLAPLAAGTHDLVIGSRHVPGGSTVGWPITRHIMSRMATLLAWPFTEAKDPMAGFFATDRARILRLRDQAAGYKILLELLVQGGDEIRVAEIPIRFEDRRQGQSKLGLSQQLTYLQRLMFLGGGRVSAGSAARFGLVGLSGMLVDLLIFHFLMTSGARLGSAHVSSFVVATVTNFVLNYRWTFYGTSQTALRVPVRYARFLAVALLALVIRGGVLVLLTESFDIPAMAAIVPAIIVTAGVNYLGAAFYVFASTASGVIPRVRWHLAALGLFAYVFVLRVLYMPHAELIPDEAYYWVYTQHLALSYLDHPPLVAWLIAAGTWLFGDTVLGVRVVLIPIALIGAWYFYLYGETMGGRTSGLLCLLAYACLPFFFASAMLMTPDAPMVVAWAAALYYFKRGLIDDKPRAFVGLGLAMGAGLLAKYSIALLAPAALVFMLVDDRARRWFFRPWPYLSVVIAGLVCLPVLIWNWQNEFASLAFQATRRILENPEFGSHRVLIFAVLLLSPVVALAAFYVLGPVRRLVAPEQRKRWFMLIMTLVPLGIITVYGVFTSIRFHWSLPPWIAILPMLMALPLIKPENVAGPLLGLIRRTWAPSLVVLVVGYGVLLHFVTLGLPGIAKSDLGSGYLGWREMAAEVHQLEQEVEQATGMRPVVAATSRWSGAAVLAFHSVDGRIDNITGQNLIGMSGSMWEYWFDEETDPDRPVILVNYTSKLIDEEWLERALVGLGPLKSRTVYRDGEPIRTLYYRIADGHRPEQVRYPDRIPEK